MASPRLFLIDDNVRTVGGHFFEVMTLLSRAGHDAGYDVHAAIHKSFDRSDAVESDVTLHPVFDTRRLVQWSLGVDGNSHHVRDIDGRITTGRTARTLESCRSLIMPRRKRPIEMLRRWSISVTNWFAEMRPTAADRIVVSTADDFCLLALAKVLRDYDTPLNIHTIVHFALVESDTVSPEEKLERIGRQVRQTLGQVCQSDQPPGQQTHQVRVFATTPPLADQYVKTNCGLSVATIPYPTRAPFQSQTIDLTEPSDKFTGPIRCTLAGWPRAEKGRESITHFLNQTSDWFDGKRFRLFAQMPASKWQSLIPPSLHPRVVVDQPSDAALEIHTRSFDLDEYHGWLDQIGLGIFLYDPKRYAARCSGVLLELMVRAVPAIVPEGSQMANEIRAHGGHGHAGLIYSDQSQIPELMTQFEANRQSMLEHCRGVAQQVAKTHHPSNTLRQMGVSSIKKIAA